MDSTSSPSSSDSASAKFVVQEKSYGTPLDSIAYALDLTSTQALDLLIEALDNYPESYLNEEQNRTLELIRLDRLLSKLEGAIENGEVDAIKAANQLSTRRAKLLGLDKDIRTQVSTQVSRYVDRILQACEDTLDPVLFRQVKLAILRRTPKTPKPINPINPINRQQG